MKNLKLCGLQGYELFQVLNVIFLVDWSSPCNDIDRFLPLGIQSRSQNSVMQLAHFRSMFPFYTPLKTFQGV